MLPPLLFQKEKSCRVILEGMTSCISLSNGEMAIGIRNGSHQQQATQRKRATLSRRKRTNRGELLQAQRKEVAPRPFVVKDHVGAPCLIGMRH